MTPNLHSDDIASQVTPEVNTVVPQQAPRVPRKKVQPRETPIGGGNCVQQKLFASGGGASRLSLTPRCEKLVTTQYTYYVLQRFYI